jgi:hypothetical protein
MIRRGFWLTAGAAAGIYGYRRVSALARRARGVWGGGQPPHDRGDPGGSSPRGYAAVALARETIRFTRDVREGMEQYRLAHSAPEGSTLGARDLEPARSLGTDHHPRPKDGR